MTDCMTKVFIELTCTVKIFPPWGPFQDSIYLQFVHGLNHNLKLNHNQSLKLHQKQNTQNVLPYELWSLSVMSSSLYWTHLSSTWPGYFTLFYGRPARKVSEEWRVFCWGVCHPGMGQKERVLLQVVQTRLNLEGKTVFACIITALVYTFYRHVYTAIPIIM